MYLFLHESQYHTQHHLFLSLPYHTYEYPRIEVNLASKCVFCPLYAQPNSRMELEDTNDLRSNAGWLGKGLQIQK